jgi:DNA-binding MarR family transcriptional regulator
MRFVFTDAQKLILITLNESGPTRTSDLTRIIEIPGKELGRELVSLQKMGLVAHLPNEHPNLTHLTIWYLTPVKR